MRSPFLFWLVIGSGIAATAGAQPVPVAKSRPIEIRHLTLADGLSSPAISALHQDRRGFVWIGTVDGLNRYDGYEVRPYRHNPADSTSLSMSYVTGIFEDDAGTLWISTFEGGINRFDADSGTFTYVSLLPGSRSPSPYKPSVVLENPVGTLWFGTNRGLFRYETQGGSVHEMSGALLGADVTSVLADRNGILWIGTSDRGVTRLDPSDPAGPRRIDGVASEAVSRMLSRFDGKIWVGGSDGSLALLDPEDLTVSGVLPPSEAAPVGALAADRAGNTWVGSGSRLARISAAGAVHWMDGTPGGTGLHMPGSVDALLEDRSGRMWVGTAGGVIQYDPSTGRTLLVHDPDRPTSLGVGPVTTLMQDLTGLIWIGHFGGGVDRYDPSYERFRQFKHDPEDANSLPADLVWHLRTDASGSVWIATDNGLARFHPETGEIERMVHGPGARTPFEFGQMTYAMPDRTGRVWIGTGGGGLLQLDPATGRLDHFYPDPGDAGSLGFPVVNAVFQDRSGTVWIGTWGGGLDRYDSESRTFTHFRHDPSDPSSLAFDRIWDLHEDASGGLWVATVGGGLDLLDRRTGRFVHHRRIADSTDGIFDDRIWDIYEDPDTTGVLWLATEGGLGRFDVARGTVRRYTSSNGLPHDVIHRIAEDQNGFLWLATHVGLARFDRATGQFRVYGASDGLKTDEFLWGLDLLPDGTMVVGGINGVSLFHPDSLGGRPTAAPVQLTFFDLFDRPYDVVHDIGRVEELQMSYDQNFFAFGFAMLDFASPERHRYRYMLEGLDRHWVDSGDRPRASYTGVPPGRYTFRVQGVEPGGEGSGSSASIRLVITPPFWRTGWFLAIMLFAVVALALFGHRMRLRRVQRHADELRELVRERTRDLEEEQRKTEEQARQLAALDVSKNRFFANVSHDFRTPLTLILSPIEDMLGGRHGDLAPEMRSELEMVCRSGRSLLHLINELLDLSRLEAGSLTVETDPGDMDALLRDVVGAFLPVAERRGVLLHYSSRIGPLPMRIDAHKIERVIGNLLSNALKYTPCDGKVWVTLDRFVGDPERTLEVVVKDTGPGVEPEQLRRMFDRFATSSRNASHPGTGGIGIGLALVKELVELMGGKVLVESDPGFGASFSVRLPVVPVGDEVRMGDEVESIVSDDLRGGLEWLEADGNGAVAVANPGAPGDDRDLILVVDDHPDLRTLVRRYLEPEYRVAEAADGLDGLEMARKNPPALILSDVVMPRMDGFELCRAIREDDLLRDTPIIMLTARAEEADAVTGFTGGADGYVLKPFSPLELRARIDHLIETRRDLRRRLSGEMHIEALEINVRPEEADFVDRLLTLVGNHIADEGLTVEQLASEIGMSHRQFTRRVKEVTGETPASLVRRLRMQRARSMLEAHAGSVSEVAYATGFRSPSHFSRLFHDTYGIHPSGVEQREPEA